MATSPPIVLAVGGARTWIGSSRPRGAGLSIGPFAVPIVLETATPGRLAVAIIFAASAVPHLLNTDTCVSLSGRVVVVVGAEGASMRNTIAYSVLHILCAESVTFVSDRHAVRVAAHSPSSIVVDVGERETRVYAPGDCAQVVVVPGGVHAVREGIPDDEWDICARALFFDHPDVRGRVPGDVRGNGGRILMHGTDRVRRPEALFSDDDEYNVGVGVLRAMSAARVLDRADGQRIVLCGGGGDIAGFGNRLLAEMKERSDKDDQYRGLRKIVKNVTITQMPFCAAMAPWIGGAVLARQGATAAGVTISRETYQKNGGLGVVDEDCCDVGIEGMDIHPSRTLGLAQSRTTSA